MKKIFHILFLSCLKATELLEKKKYFKLSFIERMKLRIHLMMCSSCSRFEKQSDLIEMGISKNIQKEITEDELFNLKKQIHKKLESLR